MSATWTDEEIDEMYRAVCARQCEPELSDEALRAAIVVMYGSVPADFALAS